MEYVERKSNLVVPEGFVELDREEMTYVDGGGTITLGVTFTLGSVISASIVSSVIGYLTGYTCTKTTKLGSMLGGLIGMAIGFFVGGLVSASIASLLNTVIYPGASGYQKVTLASFNIWFAPNITYYYDLGKFFGVCIGGFGGFAGGLAAGATAAAVA